MFQAFLEFVTVMIAATAFITIVTDFRMQRQIESEDRKKVRR